MAAVRGSSGKHYVGRFAPSPTGSLHLGSLLAAVGSYVDARANSGRWLVRMEDLDTPRVVPGCDTEILRTLELFGLQWDGTVEYQSRRTPAYKEALGELHSKGLSFGCNCSRRHLAAMEDSGYPGTCRTRTLVSGSTSIRFRIDDEATVRFQDRVQGPCVFPLKSMGDVIVRRRDGRYAYQLAVVVDDAHQGVTDVVRGADLLPSTAWQIALQTALGLPTPLYAHLPLVVEPDGSKLAKSKRSVPVDPRRASPLLWETLHLLRQEPPLELAASAPRTILDWAVANWNSEVLRGVETVTAPG